MVAHSFVMHVFHTKAECMHEKDCNYIQSFTVTITLKFIKYLIFLTGKFDVPGAPGQPEASEVTKNSCRISWEAPRNDGGTPIRGYFVERKSGAKWIRVNREPIKERHIELKDLTQGMEYEFRVNAVNDEGEGPFSKSSDMFVAKNQYEKPDPPIDLDVSNVTKSSCLLTWRPPLRNGGQPIIRYHVEMRTKGEYKFFRFTDDFISECEYEVRDLIENQEYEFRVFAENKQGESNPSEPTRKIKARDFIQGVPPEIGDMPDRGNLIGTQGKIDVKISGLPVPDVKWKKAARFIKTDSPKYSISYAQGVAVLLINNLTEEDAGSYTVEAVNEAGSDNRTCKFIVFLPPKIDYDKKYKKVSVVSVGSNYRIACQVTGCPKPEVQWSKDDAKLKKGSKANADAPTDTQYYLSIKQCDRDDSGIYKIKAENPSGRDEAQFEVQVVDVPEKPRGPIDITLDTDYAKSATINWKAPKWDGGSELISYTVEFAKVLDPSIAKSMQ